MSDYLTVQAAADYVGVTTRNVVAWIRRGVLTARRSRGNVRVWAADLLAVNESEIRDDLEALGDYSAAELSAATDAAIGSGRGRSARKS